MAKSIYRISHTKKRMETENSGDKDGKGLYKLMCNTVYGKTMEILRNRIDARLVSKKYVYLNRHQNQAIWHKNIGNDLVAIPKSKVTLTLNKPPYFGMCILDLIKLLMYKVQYDYIKINMVKTQDYYSLTLIVWCVKLKIKIFMRILIRIEKCSILAIIHLSQNIMMIQTN